MAPIPVVIDYGQIKVQTILYKYQSNSPNKWEIHCKKKGEKEEPSFGRCDYTSPSFLGFYPEGFTSKVHDLISYTNPPYTTTYIQKVTVNPATRNPRFIVVAEDNPGREFSSDFPSKAYDEISKIINDKGFKPRYMSAGQELFGFRNDEILCKIKAMSQPIVAKLLQLRQQQPQQHQAIAAVAAATTSSSASAAVSPTTKARATTTGPMLSRVRVLNNNPNSATARTAQQVPPKSSEASSNSSSSSSSRRTPTTATATTGTDNKKKRSLTLDDDDPVVAANKNKQSRRAAEEQQEAQTESTTKATTTSPNTTSPSSSSSSVPRSTKPTRPPLPPVPNLAISLPTVSATTTAIAASAVASASSPTKTSPATPTTPTTIAAKLELCNSGGSSEKFCLLVNRESTVSHLIDEIKARIKYNWSAGVIDIATHDGYKVSRTERLIDLAEQRAPSGKLEFVGKILFKLGRQPQQQQHCN